MERTVIMVKDLDSLKKLGFTETRYDDGTSSWSYNKAGVLMRVNGQTKILKLCRTSKKELETLCELYKHGYIYFKDLTRPIYYSEKLTEEELKFLKKFREEQNNVCDR